MPLTVVFPRDRAGDATYASLAAQVEAGMARVVQERRCERLPHGDRRSGKDRRERQEAREHGERAAQRRHAYPQRRQAVPLPGVLRAVVTA